MMEQRKSPGRVGGAYTIFLLHESIASPMEALCRLDTACDSWACAFLRLDKHRHVSQPQYYAKYLEYLAAQLKSLPLRWFFLFRRSRVTSSSRRRILYAAQISSLASRQRACNWRSVIIISYWCWGLLTLNKGHGGQHKRKQLNKFAKGINCILSGP
jgi:hypothetical protein